MSLPVLEDSRPIVASDIFELLKNRDAVFLDKIFRETNPMLLKILSANGFFAEAAEDLVHQTWERFFINLHRFEGRAELRTFICGILLNKIREQRRTSARFQFEEDAEKVMAKSFTVEGWWAVAAPDPSARLYDAQVSEFIAECLEGLTELQKDAFVLKLVHQQETAEICNLLDVSVSNLRVLIFRAKDKLRSCLQGKLGSTGY